MSNTYQNSISRQLQTELRHARDPLVRIGFWMNVFHSIDTLKDVSEEQRKTMKERARKNVMREFKHIGTSLQALLKSSLHSIEIWEDTRNRFFEF